ncbi:hypothetical protein SFHH103_02763 [Sinorhizobium fredii HH103]|uniref:Uncharacterized protein n=1 Tax=Sinorhizobium fredii (strain HH103) TaxID=1117943 RepID=G9ABG6_SINF1|nr:hypothetical protein SFHH103_02763 [Sinorhizobium fredii HH103]
MAAVCVGGRWSDFEYAILPHPANSTKERNISAAVRRELLETINVAAVT